MILLNLGKLIDKSLLITPDSHGVLGLIIKFNRYLMANPYRSLNHTPLAVSEASSISSSKTKKALSLHYTLVYMDHVDTRYNALHNPNNRFITDRWRRPRKRLIAYRYLVIDHDSEKSYNMYSFNFSKSYSFSFGSQYNAFCKYQISVDLDDLVYNVLFWQFSYQIKFIEEHLADFEMLKELPVEQGRIVVYMILDAQKNALKFIELITRGRGILLDYVYDVKVVYPRMEEILPRIDVEKKLNYFKSTIINDQNLLYEKFIDLDKRLQKVKEEQDNENGSGWRYF